MDLHKMIPYFLTFILFHTMRVKSYAVNTINKSSLSFKDRQDKYNTLSLSRNEGGDTYTISSLSPKEETTKNNTPPSSPKKDGDQNHDTDTMALQNEEGNRNGPMNQAQSANFTLSSLSLQNYAPPLTFKRDENHNHNAMVFRNGKRNESSPTARAHFPQLASPLSLKMDKGKYKAERKQNSPRRSSRKEIKSRHVDILSSSSSSSAMSFDRSLLTPGHSSSTEDDEDVNSRHVNPDLFFENTKIGLDYESTFLNMSSDCIIESFCIS